MINSKSTNKSQRKTEQQLECIIIHFTIENNFNTRTYDMVTNR